jgi:hypothetical protein
MLLKKTRYGRCCLSDPYLEFHRVRDAERADGTRGPGWEALVYGYQEEGERGDVCIRYRHVSPTLEGAVAWARQYWRPAELRDLFDAVAERPALQPLLAPALQGDPDQFRVLLDAVGEAGADLARGWLIRMARQVGLFTRPLPEQPEEPGAELAERRRLARDCARRAAREADRIPRWGRPGRRFKLRWYSGRCRLWVYTYPDFHPEYHLDPTPNRRGGRG